MNIHMASNHRSRPFGEPQSGGKIIRPRRTHSAKTPYERPQPSNSASQSPSWLSRYVYSPARFVATGAGKLLSSAINLEDSPTSSSETYSSSELSYSSDSSAEKQISTFDDDNDIGNDILRKSKTFKVNNCSGKELLPLVGNIKNKQVIVQLLMQETFSREECDQLIKIIRSRVGDSAANEDGGEKRPNEISNRTLGDANTPDICSAAVMEAKKWLKEKKSGLDSKLDLGQGNHSLNLVTLPKAFEDEGSPVYVAKSYMRQRPPWASPSIDHAKPSTPIGIQLFKEEIAYPIIGNSTSSSKLKRDSPATGSWSIQDEIRRVRSRATEEMLRTRPSSNLDWSAITVEYKYNPNSSATENIEASTGERLPCSTSSLNASLNLAKGLSTQVSPDLESKQDGFQTEAVLTDPANINSDQNEGFEAIQQTEALQDDPREITAIEEQPRSSDDMMAMVHSDDGLIKVNGSDDSNGASHQLNSIKETREVSNRLSDGNCLVFTEKVGAEDTLTNGYSGPSFSEGQVIEQNTILNNEHSAVGPHHERIAKDVIEEEPCELLSETLEVPDNTIAINEDDNGVATGSQSQNSSSIMQHGVQEDHSQRISEPEWRTTNNNVAEKQMGRRVTRHTRRGRKG